jgi:hypothetical protein
MNVYLVMLQYYNFYFENNMVSIQNILGLGKDRRTDLWPHHRYRLSGQPAPVQPTVLGLQFCFLCIKSFYTVEDTFRCLIFLTSQAALEAPRILNLNNPHFSGPYGMTIESIQSLIRHHLL